MKILQPRNLIFLVPAMLLSVLVGNVIGTIDFSETESMSKCTNNPGVYDLNCHNRYAPIIDYDVNLIPSEGSDPGIEKIPTSTEHQIILLNK